MEVQELLMKEMNFARKWLTLLQKTYILKIVYNEVDKTIEKHEIQIDQITSGKVNIFTFYRNRKQIDDHFLRLQEPSLTANYFFHFHFDAESLHLLQKEFPSVYPYDGSETIHDWTEKMKAELQHQIQTGKWNKRVRIGNRILDVVFTWCDEDIVE